MTYSEQRFVTPMSIGIVVFMVTSLMYWGYKKIREPAYKPGCVAKLFEEAEDDGQDAQPTDDGTSRVADDGNDARTWKMPNGMSLFYFSSNSSSSSGTKKTKSSAATSATNTNANANIDTNQNKYPILCLHGGPAIAPSTPWKVFDELAKSHDVDNEVYLYHARGCGKSTRPFSKFPTPGMWPGMKIIEQELGIGAQVADMERIRKDHLKVDRLHLVGHSFGGFIATMYATEFPDRVASLVLMVPAGVLQLPAKNKAENGDIFAMVKEKLAVIEASNLQPEEGQQNLQTEFDAFMKKYLDFGSLPTETDESLAERQYEFAQHYYRADFDGDEAKVKAEMEKVDKSMIGGMACFATFLSMGMEHDYIPECRRRLSGSSFPVSIVHGGKDMIPEYTSRQYMKIFPPHNQPQFHSIPDVEIFDHPDAFGIVHETIKRGQSK